MKYILDTNAVASLMKGDARVLARLARVAPQDVAIPHPVMAEIEYGIRRLPRSKRKDMLAQRLDLLKTEIQRCTWTDAVSETFGEIKASLERKGVRIEDFDAAVAAHAVASGGILVTANTKHMVRVVALEIEDWSESPEES